MKFFTLEDTVREFESWKRNRTGKSGFEWNFPFFDRELGLAEPGECYIIGGNPNAGKSFLGMAIVAACPEKALYVSLEDGPGVVARRVATLPLEARQRALVSFGEGYSEDLVATIQAAAAEGVRLVVVDHMSDMELSPGSREPWSRGDEVTKVLKALKKVARTTAVVIVLLAHLKRSPKSKKPPTMQDLAESASLERKAQAIFLMHTIDRTTVSVILEKSKSTPAGATALYTRGEGGWLQELAPVEGEDSLDFT